MISRASAKSGAHMTATPAKRQRMEVTRQRHQPSDSQPWIVICRGHHSIVIGSNNFPLFLQICPCTYGFVQHCDLHACKRLVPSCRLTIVGTPAVRDGSVQHASDAILDRSPQTPCRGKGVQRVPYTRDDGHVVPCIFRAVTSTADAVVSTEFWCGLLPCVFFGILSSTAVCQPA
jgi:hypothetical protein